MKNLKQKFKRALAAFLRDEILEYIGYNHKIPLTSLNDRFTIDNIPFDTMVMEVEVPIYEGGIYDSRENEMMLERQIEEAKKKFTSQMMDHIHVDAQNLTSREHYMRRSIKLVLRIQGKK